MSCEGLTKSGRACQYRLAPGVILCPNHDPKQNVALAARKASEAARVARRKRVATPDLLRTVLSLTDRTSIQAALDVAMRLYLDGRIDHEKYRDIVHGCSVAMRNFDKTGDTMEGPSPQGHSWDGYFERVKRLLGSIDLLLAPEPEEIESGTESNEEEIA